MFVENLAWDEVEAALKRGALSVVSVGAAAKEHGFHLPMNSDALQARWLAEQAASMGDVLVWPVVNMGFYPAFAEFPGVSLRREVFQDVMRDVLTSIQKRGGQKILILDTGVSTSVPLDELCDEESVFCFHMCGGPHFLKARSEVEDQLHGGGHADEHETSIMLHLYPEAVRMERAQGWTHDYAFERGVLRREDKGDVNYCPSGVTGDPSFASADKGKVLAQARLEDLRAAVNKLL